MYYFIEPEVAGGWGANTIADTSVHPPLVSKLHYQFEGWLGDALLESFPCYIVTEALKDDLVLANLVGFEVLDVEVSKSPDFVASEPGVVLPKFFWLKVSDRHDNGDFRISPDYRLMASEKALKILQKHNISHADIATR